MKLGFKDPSWYRSYRGWIFSYWFSPHKYMSRVTLLGVHLTW